VFKTLFTVLVAVEERHNPLGVVPFLKLVGVGVFKFVNIDSTTQHKLLLHCWKIVVWYVFFVEMLGVTYLQVT
jgi:hypothetical protein